MRQLARSVVAIPIFAALAASLASAQTAACVAPSGRAFSPVLRAAAPPPDAAAPGDPGFTSTIGGRFITFPANDDGSIGTRIGPPTNTFIYPSGVAVDAAGRLFVADTLNSRIRLFDRNGVLLRDFGSEGSRYELDPNTWMPVVELWGASANPDRLLNPLGVALDGAGRLYVADSSNHRVLVFTIGPAPEYRFTLVTAFGSWGGWVSASTAEGGASIQGRAPAPGELNYPMGLAVDSVNRRLFVADTWNGRIQAYDFLASTNAYDTARATSIGAPGEAPGELDAPQSVAFDASTRRLLVADTNNHRIVIFDPYAGGGAAVVASVGNIDQYGEGHPGIEPRQFYMPGGVAVYGNGFMVADTGNDRIQLFDANSCYQLSIQNPAPMAPGNVAAPQGLAADGNRIVVADTNNHRIQIFNPAALAVSTLDISPASLHLGEGTITVSVTVSNTGSAPLANVTPRAVVTQPENGVVNAAYAGGSAIAALPAGASAQLALQFTPINPGAATIAVGATGNDPVTGQTVTFDPVGSLSVSVRERLGPSMSVSAIVPAAVSCGATFDVVVTVKNTGNVALRGVSAEVNPIGSGVTAVASASLAKANPISLEAGEIQTFTYQMTAGPAVGMVGFNVAANALSAGDGSPVRAESVASVRVSDDAVPPVTTAALSRVPNANGWVAGPVTVTLSADDRGGKGVGSIHYEYVIPGAAAPSVTTGQNPVSFAIPDFEGTITILYWSTDKAAPANREPLKRLDVRIDSTAPLISPRELAAPNPYGWYAAPVSYPFTVSELSGIVSVTDAGRNQRLSSPYALLLTAQGPAVSGSASAVDLAGNVAAAVLPPVRIDLTRPCIDAARLPAPNANGWNNTPVTVTFKGYDPAPASYTPSAALPLLGACTLGAIGTDHLLASGTASLSGPVTVASEGSNHVISGSIADRAGNTATAVALAMIANVPTPIRLDRTAPEVFHQFDLVSKDAVVIGCDDLSGIAGAPAVFQCHQGATADALKAAPAQVSIASPSTRKGDDDEDGGGPAEFRTYKIVDAAGNTITLVQRERRGSHNARIDVVSVQQTAGCPTDCRPGSLIEPDSVTTTFEWSVNVDGSVKELTQKMDIGQGAGRRRVTAKYDSRTDETVIEDSVRADKSVGRSGYVALRMATSGGALAIEY